MWHWDAAWNMMPALLEGLQVTIQATFGGIALALSLGLVFAILRRSESPLIAWPVAGFIEFVRSTPLLVQLFFLFYALPTLAPQLTMGALTTGIVGLGVHYAAYTSEVYRAGIESVPRGQWEASRTLSLGMLPTWISVVLPQAIPVVIPALGNYFIAMFKEAPLLATITVVELLAEGRITCNRTGFCLEAYTLVGAIFLAISIPASILVRRLEHRLGVAQA